MWIRSQETATWLTESEASAHPSDCCRSDEGGQRELRLGNYVAVPGFYAIARVECAHPDGLPYESVWESESCALSGMRRPISRLERSG